MAHRPNSSMDKPNQELRPYCETHSKWFRNWMGAKNHEVTSTGKCRIVSKFKATR
jgi:hypothetical protein